MKISVTLINSIIIMTIVSIILIAVVPYLCFNLLEKHVVDEAVISFKKYEVVLDSIFTSEYFEEPDNIEGFNYERLIDLGEQLEIDFSDTISKSKEPYGGKWLISSFSITFIKLIHNLSSTILTAYNSNRTIAAILSLLGLLFVFILGKILLKKLNTGNDDETSSTLLSRTRLIYRLIVSLVITAGICYTIFQYLRNLIIFIKHPPILRYPIVNVSSSYYFESVVILTGILILISILVSLIRKSNNKTVNYLAYFWTVPVFAIILNLYLDNFQISMLNNMVSTQNFNSQRQINVIHTHEITCAARQWYLQNDGKYTLKDYLLENNIQTQTLEHGTYEISADDTLLTITGAGSYVSKEENSPKVAATFNSVTDSLKVEILQ